MNDKELRQNVIDELEFEPSIDSANIGVAAENGVVTLSGHVASYIQKVDAERAVWRVKGVKAIAQELDVRLPWDKKVNDDEIAKRALDILAWSTLVPSESIKVLVRDGWVTLSGRVNWNYQRDAAAREIRKLTGVLGLVNNITLEPAAQKVDIRQRVMDALKRHAEVEAARIGVDVDSAGGVKLSGLVDGWEERRAVERAVWSAPGVHSIEDNIRIN
ncbi:BON domain-containing protein [Pseudoxanthomonas sacheonensis]|uniref:BON domain-containing protein n=1 Tax=Pseudoxanthomonas sacheonensis TaxID=443615 RepID=UPI0013CFA5D3|nr:BON domain-containing protein [Pseudoxanthomonas sacheonensis]KAF1710750.1 ornithine aminotransferase [Pseudoxanthomonas sacheonensis]